MTKKMSSVEWDLLSRLAYDYEEYEKVGTEVASRGQETLQGTIVEVDFELDSTDLCYCIDWGYDRVEWCSRDEFYRVTDEDAKELINPHTNKQYTQSRYPEEVGWFRYGKELNKKAQYNKKHYGHYEKKLYWQGLKAIETTEKTNVGWAKKEDVQ